MHHSDGTRVYGTNSAICIWQSSVWHQQCTVDIVQHCMAPRVYHTDGTAMCGTNSATYRFHNMVWQQQCSVQMTQQCMAPTVHRTDGTAVYGTNSAPYRRHSSVWHQQCSVLWCDISNSGVQLLLAEGRKVIIVRAGGEAGFFHNSLFIFKYSYKLIVVMAKCEDDRRWLNENLTDFASTLC